MTSNNKQDFIMIDGMKLEKISIEEIKEYRKKSKSLLIVKRNVKDYYIGEVDKNFSGINDSKFKSHKCGVPCKRLMPLSYEAGGCEKVRESSKGIEDFSWIKKGYETLNTDRKIFVVCKCNHYEEEEERKRPSSYEINRARRNIAELYLKQ